LPFVTRSYVKVVNQRQRTRVWAGYPRFKLMVVRVVRRMYTRESGRFAKFFADAGDILFANLFNLRGAI